MNIANICSNVEVNDDPAVFTGNSFFPLTLKYSNFIQYVKQEFEGFLKLISYKGTERGCIVCLQSKP